MVRYFCYEIAGNLSAITEIMLQLEVLFGSKCVDRTMQNNPGLRMCQAAGCDISVVLHEVHTQS